MMHKTRLFILAAMLLPGCGWFQAENKADKEGTVDAETLKKAIQTAKSIKKDPTKAAAVLKEAGYTEEEFEALVYKIALDDAASEKYAKALKDK